MDQSSVVTIMLQISLGYKLVFMHTFEKKK